MIVFDEAAGIVTLTDDNDPTRTQVIPLQLGVNIEAQIQVFLGVDLVAKAKADKRAAINMVRDQIENDTAPTPFGVAQCDINSRDKINGAVLMALLATQQGQPFSVSWTMADNSQVTFNAQQMIQFGMAVGQYVATIHAKGVAKKAAVDACTTVDEVNAIDIEAGW